MSGTETAICHRLRDFRKATRLTRVSFANLANIESTRLANYEHARAPVRFGLVRTLAESFDLNPIWLATGRGSPIGCVPLERMVPNANDADVFSRIYQKHLRGRYPRESEKARMHWDQFIQDLRRSAKLLPHLKEEIRRSPAFRKKTEDFMHRLEAFSREIKSFGRRRRLIEREIKKGRRKA